MCIEEDTNGWKAAALAEIASVKTHFIEKHGWRVSTIEQDNSILFYVEFQHAKNPKNKKVLRLQYGPNFPRERPRENFVDPNDYQIEGKQCWIDDGQKAFKSNRNPPAICLEGTWGFHHDLHKDRPVQRAILTKLLLEVQACFNGTN